LASGGLNIMQPPLKFEIRRAGKPESGIPVHVFADYARNFEN
jgi:hypothetical protein